MVEQTTRQGKGGALPREAARRGIEDSYTVLGRGVLGPAADEMDAFNVGKALAERAESIEVEISERQRQAEASIAERARQFAGQEQRVWEYFRSNPQAVASVRAPIFEEKVVDFIVELANVTGKKVTRDELFKPEDESAA